jgi:WD40 repeat protein
VRLLDAATGRTDGELAGPTGQVTAVAIGPGGRYVAATAGPYLWAWEAGTAEVVLRVRFDNLNFRGVAFTPDGRHLLTVRSDATVRVWNTGSWTEQVAYNWEIGPLVSLAVAPDGQRAAAGSKKGRIIIWDLDM